MALASEPVCLADFEEYARHNLARKTFEFYASGANDEQTLHDNKKAFKRLMLRPRVLRGISEVDMCTTLLGEEISMPICVAPTAFQKMAHPDAELATAKAADAAATCMVISLWSTEPLEEISDAVPHGLRWQQIKFFYDEKMTIRLIRRAEKTGCKAFVLTVDSPAAGRHLSDVRNKFTIPFDLPNLFDSKGSSSDLSKGSQTVASVVKKLANPYFGDSVLKWFRSQTKLAFILKGILTAEDAIKAVQYGVDGIIVSNQGGRQLDGVPAALDALPEVVDAVKGRVEVYMDGGVRLGTDVLKALALGARAVFIGRPVIWGLAYEGEQGVHKVLEILREELRLAMILSGRASLAEINKSVLWKHRPSQL